MHCWIWRYIIVENRLISLSCLFLSFLKLILNNFSLFLFTVTDSSIFHLHSALETILWVHYFLLLKWIYFKTISHCLLEPLHNGWFNILSQNPNICVISMLVSVDFLFPCKLEFSRFFIITFWIIYPGLVVASQATITEHHMPGWLKKQAFISHGSGCCKIKIKCGQSWLQMRPLSLAFRSCLLAVPSHSLFSVDSLLCWIRISPLSGP